VYVSLFKPAVRLKVRRASVPATCLVLMILGTAAVHAQSPVTGREAATALTAYFEAMSVPEPFPVLTGDALTARQQELRSRLLNDVGLDPLPERIDLDVHKSAPIDHPWCTIEKIEYQLWPGVYTSGLLFTPKEFVDRPAPGMLCPHGHWKEGYAAPDVQKRCVVLAKMGYVVLSPKQNHYEDLALGISHQTHMIWTNMRGIDLLQSLPEVDPERIGVAGASGGGLQTQMVTALDARVQAATIVGLTCDYREIMFPHAAHCECNHWPNVMSYTDWPEISALAFPRPIQYLVMNDWTRHFPHDNYPTILDLYRANGHPDRASCTYWPTEHAYDQPKRERTYWWMEKWLRNDGDFKQPIPDEPKEVVTISPPETINDLPIDNPRNKGLSHLSTIFRERFHFVQRNLDTQADWAPYQKEMAGVLPQLLGLDARLPTARKGMELGEARRDGGALVEQVLFPSEGDLRLPGLIVRPAGDAARPWPVSLVLRSGGSTGRDKAGSYVERAMKGELVVLADIRFTGVYDLAGLAGKIGPDLVKHNVASNLSAYEKPEDQLNHLLWAWERNGIVWGRPIVGMAVSDIRSVLQALEQYPAANLESVRIETHGTAYLGLAAVFAGILDPRIRVLDVDLNGCRYETYRNWRDQPDGLPIIPFILRYGDVPQWLAVLGDREVTAHNLSVDASESTWLKQAFAAARNEDGLHIAIP